MNFPVRKFLFSLKTFTAGMLALNIAFNAGLQNPYWALLTVYVLMQPLTGATLSKSLFRLGGTLIGAIVGIALKGFFGSAQLPLMLALTAWVCGCLYLAIMDRQPRRYVFMLTAVTAALVAWPGGLSAGSTFAIALARLEEISLGIVCVVLIDGLFPFSSARPAVNNNVGNCLDEAQTFSLNVLQASKRNPDHHETARSLASQAAALNAFATYLRHETPQARAMVPWLRALQQHILFLLPVLSSTEDRLLALQQVQDPLPEYLVELLADVGTWIEQGKPRSGVVALKRRISQLKPEPSETLDWEGLLLLGLLENLRTLVSLWSRCRELQAKLASPDRRPSRRLNILAQHTSVAAHVDHGKAVRTLVAGLLAAAICAGFWYLTGWAQGGIASLLSLIFCMFLGIVMDDPAPMLAKFAWVAVVASIINAIYLFWILPSLSSFVMFALALGVMLLPLGMLAFKPLNLMFIAPPIAFSTLSPTISTNFALYVNAMVAIVVGVVVATWVTRIVRSMSAETSARRLFKAGRNDLEQIALGRWRRTDDAFTSRMLDRLGLLAPIMNSMGPEVEMARIDVLAEIRLGLNLSRLRRLLPTLARPEKQEVETLMALLGAYFHRHGSYAIAPPENVLQHLDDALGRLMVAPGPHNNKTIFALAGIRRALFPQASPWAGLDGNRVIDTLDCSQHQPRPA